MGRNAIELSRVNWWFSRGDNEDHSREVIELGCMQRIAAAVEMMARNAQAMEHYRDEAEKQKRKARALRLRIKEQHRIIEELRSKAV